MFVFKHPKYYTELRKLRNKLDQVISSEAGDGERERAPDPGLKQQATSAKQQATSLKLQATSFKPQAQIKISNKPQAPSCKLQAPSRKRQAP
jgi:hypothetical protein